ncbi:phage holin family protein [Ramlibacter tataouinensis]|uniref:Candidate membrane protein n=1 Tax=Ramlibacter tataouinensis (strain ATCC BAA-407 / DSM 14655 / LMG 21543 / TTB310) TaxID=365046 RepID=F5XWQ3_RAMTT|nr:phage holin family protein [Ramlibacter tataouinensis]AEG94197.1 hypothetical protein Rta_30870 [Ramlibacter tataouinensis TTB310]
MVHPIFSVLVSKPELVMDHVAGYAALAREEASTVGGQVARCAIAWAIAGVCGLVFLILAGVALMLGAVHEFSWMLVIVPAALLAAAVAAAMAARKRMPTGAFTELRSQLDADAQALRTLGAR